MRIALYHFPSLRAGGDTFIFDLASSLVKCGHSVHIITSNQFPLVGGKRNLAMNEILHNIGGAILHEFPFINVLPHPASISEIRSILRDCDVLYAKNEIFELSQLKILKSGINLPTICGIHTAVFYPYSPSFRSKMHNILYMSKAYAYLLHQCDAIHVLNGFDLNLMRMHFRVGDSNIFLTRLGVDTDVFYPKNVSKVTHEDEKLKILFLNKLDEQKGLDILSDAIQILLDREEFNQMVFTIAGSGKLGDLAYALSQTYSNVGYLGFVPQEMIVDLYNWHDVVVVPSRWETLSYVCLEAQSCGVPVIASNIPGPSSIIKHGETGFLIPPEDPKLLAGSILYMYRTKNESPYAFNEMKNFSRENIVNRFSLEVEAKNITTLFNFISSRPRSDRVLAYTE